MNIENALIQILTEMVVEQQAEIAKIKEELDDLDEWQDVYLYYFVHNSQNFPCECDSCQIKTVVRLDDTEAVRVCRACGENVYLCERCVNISGAIVRYHVCQ
jgi:hypothetical protein